MKYKMLATDLDGTLLNSVHELSPENKHAIENAVQKGLKVVLCSGRSHESMNHIAEAAGLNKKGCFGISFNGAVVYEADTVQPIFEKRLNLDYALKTIALIKWANPETPILAYYDGDQLYCERENNDIVEYKMMSKIKTSQVKDFNAVLDKDILKIIIKWDAEKLKDIEHKIKDKLEGISNMFYSANDLMEFGPIGVNKSEGIRFLAKHLGMDMSEVVCIGDNYNDYEMVKESGFGAAVKNAVDELKEIADYVTENDNNNHAVKEIIEKIL